jgi:hypothetical protein
LPNLVKQIVCALSVASFLLLAGTASALGPSAAVLAGYAPTDDIDDAIPYGYNFGLGARAGFTLPFNIYAGGTFVYHVGQHRGETSSNVWYTGGEFGYDIEAGLVTIRPYVGLGYAHFRQEASSNYCGYAPTCGGFVHNMGRFALWPGVAVNAEFENQFFVGVDLRYVKVFELLDADAPGIFLAVGRRF